MQQMNAQPNATISGGVFEATKILISLVELKHQQAPFDGVWRFSCEELCRNSARQLTSSCRVVSNGEFDDWQKEVYLQALPKLVEAWNSKGGYEASLTSKDVLSGEFSIKAIPEAHY